MIDERKTKRLRKLAGELAALSATNGGIGEAFDINDGKALVIVMHGNLARGARDDLNKLLEQTSADVTCGNA